MIKPARLIGFAAIALAAFGTAASIAAIGRSDDLAVTRYSDLQFAPPALTAGARTASAACSVSLLPGAADAGAVDLHVGKGEIMDLDMPGSAGFTVACGADAAAPAATATLGESALEKTDLASL